MLPIICLEGVIGAGKTTLAKQLVKELTSKGYAPVYYPEYVNIPLLQQYISNMEKYSYAFQVIMLHQRFNTYRQAIEYIAKDKKNVAILDRGYAGDYAFAFMQYKKGYFSEEEWQTYLAIVNEQKELLTVKLDYYRIYLQCDLNTCLQRIKKRDRSVEDKYTFQYLQELEMAHKHCEDYIYFNNESNNLIYNAQELLQLISL
jgi:deoxyadenosine/deoxycytidine kinase